LFQIGFEFSIAHRTISPIFALALRARGVA